MQSCRETFGLEDGKANREARKVMKEAKEEWNEEQCKNIEAEAYNILKALTKTQQRKSAIIEDSSGNILTKAQLY